MPKLITTSEVHSCTHIRIIPSAMHVWGSVIEWWGIFISPNILKAIRKKNTWSCLLSTCVLILSLSLPPLLSQQGFFCSYYTVWSLGCHGNHTKLSLPKMAWRRANSSLPMTKWHIEVIAHNCLKQRVMHS